MEAAGGAAPASPAAQGDEHIGHAAPLQDGGRPGGAPLVGHGHPGELFGFPLVGRNPFQEGIEAGGKGPRRGGIQQDGHLCLLRPLRRPADGLQGGLQLQEQRRRPLQVVQLVPRLLGRKGPVGPQGHGNGVLPLPIHQNQRRATGLDGVHEQPRFHALPGHALGRLLPEKVLPHLSDENGPPRRKETGHRHRLVGSLPPRRQEEDTPRDGLPRQGEALIADGHVGVGAA